MCFYDYIHILGFSSITYGVKLLSWFCSSVCAGCLSYVARFLTLSVMCKGLCACALSNRVVLDVAELLFLDMHGFIRTPNNDKGQKDL